MLDRKSIQFFKFAVFSCMLLFFQQASAQKYYKYEHKQNVNNFLYTVSNDISGSSVIGYEVKSDGTLDQLNGSPFPTGGFGTGTVLFNQDGIIVSEDKEHMFVINPGSSTISVLSIQKDGSLVQLKGSPFSSGGFVPVSLALKDNLLYVSHIGQDVTNCDFCDIRGFRIKIKHGAVKAVELPAAKFSFVSSEFDTAARRIPLVISFNPKGDILVASRFLADLPTADRLPSFIDTFKVNHYSGRLTPAPGSPASSQDPRPIGFDFRPTNPSQLVFASTVEFPQDLASEGTLSAYLIAETGQVAPLMRESVGSGEQVATCWVTFSSDGRYVFTTNTFSDTITTYEMSEAGALSLLEIEPVPSDGSGPAFPLEIVVSDDDRFVYVVNGQSANISVYATSNGQLELLGTQSESLPDGDQPFGLVLVSK